MTDIGTAIFSEDPLKETPYRTRISLVAQPIFFQTEHNSDNYDIDQWSSTNGVLLAMHFSSDKVSILNGTAVMVAPGIAITAAHVLEEYESELNSGELHLTCIGFRNSEIQLWSVEKYTICNGTDLAIIFFRAASSLPINIQLHSAILDSAIPQVDDKIYMTGFRPDSAKVIIDEHGNFELVAQAILAVGTVSQVFLNGRGAKFPGPTLEVTFPSWGGMSGGPVFNEHGQLVGVLAGAMVSPGEHPTPSFVSLIHPALTTEVQGIWPIGFYGEPEQLMNLPFVNYHKGANLIEIKDEIGKTTSFRFDSPKN